MITGLETGGAEGMLARLVTRTDTRRFPSVVVSMTDGGALGPTLPRAGIEVRTLGIRRGMPDPRGLMRLVALVRKLRPDIMQTWLYHADLLGLLACRLCPGPALLWNVRCSESVGATVVRSVLSRLSAVPDRILVNSLTGKRYHEGIGYHPRRWEYIPNGFDTVSLRPDSAARRLLRAALDIDEAAMVIGMVARYHPMKDHATFLDAAARLAVQRPEVVFVLVGSGVESGNRELMRLIGRHGLDARVRLLGERSDMNAVYPGFDLATSSSGFGEGFSNVLAEAMACGVPCVATDSGDSGEIIGRAGTVVPAGDPTALAAGWGALLALDPEARRSLAAAARERIVANYDIGAVVGRYVALYEEVVAERRPSRRSA